MSLHPHREFIVQKSIKEVKTAILHVKDQFPEDYKLEALNDVMNQIRFVRTGLLLDMGYYIDMIMSKVNDSETKIVIEVSKRGGVINRNVETGNATEVMNGISTLLDSALDGSLSVIASRAKEIKANRENSMTKFLVILIVVVIVSIVLYSLSVRQ